VCPHGGAVITPPPLCITASLSVAYVATVSSASAVIFDDRLRRYCSRIRGWPGFRAFSIPSVVREPADVRDLQPGGIVEFFSSARYICLTTEP
jgi:hypothetical protein